jgi:DnaJ family protein A protein 2
MRRVKLSLLAGKLFGTCFQILTNNGV